MREAKLRKIIRQELTRVVEVEKASRPGEDPPAEGKVFEKKSVNVLDWLVSYLPYIEAGLRGMQQDVAKNNNKITKELTPAIEELMTATKAVSNILIEHEDNLLQISKLAEKLKPVLEIAYEGNSKKRLDNKTLD